MYVFHKQPYFYRGRDGKFFKSKGIKSLGLGLPIFGT